MLLTRLKIGAAALIAAAAACGLQLEGPARAGEAPHRAEAPSPQKDHARIRQLIERLGDSKFAARESAARALVKLGADAAPQLRKALEHEDAEVRMRARRVLDAIMTSPAYLKAALTDADRNVRKEAAATAERLGDKARELVPTLISGLRDADESVREAMVLALLAVDPENKALADTVPLKASVNGKYGKLLKRIHVPGDKQSYTEFHDYGQYQGTSYAGHDNLPAGYWVYVHPHWYIWGEQKK